MVSEYDFQFPIKSVTIICDFHATFKQIRRKSAELSVSNLNLGPTYLSMSSAECYFFEVRLGDPGAISTLLPTMFICMARKGL